jgi:hypothetical protein
MYHAVAEFWLYYIVAPVSAVTSVFAFYKELLK